MRLVTLLPLLASLSLVYPLPIAPSDGVSNPLETSGPGGPTRGNTETGPIANVPSSPSDGNTQGPSGNFEPASGHGRSTGAGPPTDRMGQGVDSGGKKGGGARGGGGVRGSAGRGKGGGQGQGHQKGGKGYSGTTGGLGPEPGFGGGGGERPGSAGGVGKGPLKGGISGSSNSPPFGAGLGQGTVPGRGTGEEAENVEDTDLA